MSDRSIKAIVGTTPQPGTGILHPFPTPELPHIDPFVFLDTGAPKTLGSHDIYVGPHPHRGVQPVSLLFKGRIEHRDSLGNHRTITSGGIQWLVAASGALHEEVLNGDDDGVFHMAQLWINLPAALKMKPPEYQAVPADQIPEITSLGSNATVRLYAGEVAGRTGPAPIPTPVLVAHVILEAGGAITIPVPRGWTTALCVVDGKPRLGDGTALDIGDTPVFKDDGDSITITSDGHAEVLLMCGQPIGENIAVGGGFVMNTREEIDQAHADFAAGKFGTIPTRDTSRS